jgi:hypothetical protein
MSRYMSNPMERKKQLIKVWNRRGVIHNDFDALYEEYQNQSYCQVCGADFNKKYDKCLDHDHDSGSFRFILCRRCNIQDRWVKYFCDY